MLDLPFFARYRVLPSLAWQRATRLALTANAALTRTRIVLEGLERLPKAPALLATNSTQKYDFFPIRLELARRGILAVTVTKAKNYNSAGAARFLERTGVVPIASRGYFITWDFQQVHQRRPTEQEYRALRDHIDAGVPLPAGPAFEKLQTGARDMLGRPFDPASEAWGDAVRDLYERMMGETLRLCREAIAAGYHVQMYPEGTVSSRLSRGRIGAVQLAQALGLPILPIGMSGCRAAMRGPTFRGGEVVIRFGEPWADFARDWPADHHPFRTADEAGNKPALQATTDALMQRIDGLLDPQFRALDWKSDGKTGTARFL